MDSAADSTHSRSPTLVNEDSTTLWQAEDPTSSYSISDSERNFSSDDEADDEDNDRSLEWHGDHQDLVVFQNPWDDEWSADWRHSWVQRDEHSPTNDQLYENKTTQRWMKALSTLHLSNIAFLVSPYRGPDSCSIPLFTDDRGWEYQIRLHIGRGSALPRIHCPSVLDDHQPWSSPLFELRRRVEVDQTLIADESPAPPRTFVSLGKLVVRNDYRSSGFFPPGEHVTESTDYSVVVDVGHEDMPLWLLAPRPQLQKRLDNPFWPLRPVPFLPIFDGLTMKEDDCGYDSTCILSSVRRLGAEPPDPAAPSYQEACELVRRTRGIIDPAALRLPLETVQSFLGGQPILVSYNMVPYSELGSSE